MKMNNDIMVLLLMSSVVLITSLSISSDIPVQNLFQGILSGLGLVGCAYGLYLFGKERKRQSN